jgi:2-polyprenyl-6-methoxyphenol hydroxylase-like FAD-dependent oxidoreductase
MRFVINGVGVAGPTLAFWLRHAGHEVLLVEAAPRFSCGGHVIDFGLAGTTPPREWGRLPNSGGWGTR